MFVLRVEKCLVSQVPWATQAAAPLGQSRPVVEPPTHAGGKVGFYVLLHRTSIVINYEIRRDFYLGLWLNDMQTPDNTVDDLKRNLQSRPASSPLSVLTWSVESWPTVRVSPSI